MHTRPDASPVRPSITKHHSAPLRIRHIHTNRSISMSRRHRASPQPARSEQGHLTGGGPHAELLEHLEPSSLVEKEVETLAPRYGAALPKFAVL